MTAFVKEAKPTELENKTPDVSNLATRFTLTTVENKIKTDYNAKVTEIENILNSHNHGKYITTSDFHTLAADVFDTRLAQANLKTKRDFDTKSSRINKKIRENKIKNLLVKNDLNKLKTFDSSYFIDKSHFEEECTKQVF